LVRKSVAQANLFGNHIAFGGYVVQVARNHNGSGKLFAVKHMMLVSLLIEVTHNGIIQSHIAQIELNDTGSIALCFFKNNVIGFTGCINAQVGFTAGNR
jgi:hypothetical protein